MVESDTALKQIFGVSKPIIGMVHLRPLPGSPLYDPRVMDMQEVIDVAIEEASALEAGGVDGLQVENIWDYPYLKGSSIGYETVAALAVATSSVRQAVKIPVGVNCHLNGGKAALAAACAAGASWVRVFEWVNAYISHAGLTEGIGGELARYRSMLRANDIKFLCDVNVKHGSHFIISDRSIEEQAHDAESEGADVLIVTGFETGIPPTPDKVRTLSEHVNVPVLVGSGMTADNAGALLEYADGAIVGSYFKEHNNWKGKVDQDRVCEFMSVIRRVREGQ